MQPYFEIILDDKIYSQRTENSKFIEFNLNGIKQKTYDILPNEIKEMVILANKMNENPKDYFHYQIIDNEVTINSIIQIYTPYIKIPETIEGYPVTKLGPDVATQISATIKQIQLPDTITSLAKDCFLEVYALKHINIPENLKHISPYCFMGCKNLLSVNLDHVETIDACAFANCKSLKSISCKKLCALYSSAFTGCEKLKSIDIQGKLLYIPYSCFKGCRALENVSLSDSIIRIQDSAFSGCSIKNFVVPKALRHIESFAFYNNKIENLTINNDVEIDKTSFSNTNSSTPKISSKHENIKER